MARKANITDDNETGSISDNVWRNNEAKKYNDNKAWIRNELANTKKVTGDLDNQWQYSET